MKKYNLLIGAGVIAAAGLVLGALASCSRTSIPEGVSAVTPFDAKKYLGTWYEIARFDFRFERNMDQTTAHYSLNDNGSIKVVNRGFNTKKNKWKESQGKAVFVGDPNVGMLKVSFFGPFYSGYNIVELDENYRYALIMGKNLDYLWILSREKSMPEEILQQYLQKAKDTGYDLSRLIWVDQK